MSALVLRCLATRRVMVPAALAAGVLLAAAAPQGCRRGPAPQMRPAPSGDAAPQRSDQQAPAGARARVEVGEIVVADPAGKRLWRASAASLEWDNDKQQAVLRDAQCHFTDDGKLALEARAPLATAYLAERRVVLEGGVTARAPATETSLRAERLEWKVEDKEVYATGNVKYVRGAFALSGPRLRADLGLRKARLEGGVELQAVEPPRRR
ncbi:MAG TPA: LPS export ABC transporter periplasmic protein LptC [Armatimonadota bacterium]|nr:LPS export ABC transporter periplasmic protein LptC [Armatimonadota bacterium]